MSVLSLTTPTTGADPAPAERGHTRSPQERKIRTAELIAEARQVTGAERDALLEQVIVLNIPVAHSLAARYRNRGQPLEELQQVACLALTRAVQNFDPERGEDLLVFAVPSILGELKRYFRDVGWSIRPPRRLQELRPRLVEAEELLSQVLGRPPSLGELADELSCSVEEVQEAKACADLGRTSSLDEPVSESGSALGDLLAEEDPGFGHGEAIAVLAPVCRRLKQRDRKILRMRFYEQMTQQEIADELGVTQVQVSRLLKRILEDLRTAVGGMQQTSAA
ncbi:sigma-70 family RNA polymerase sigma factor [Nocardioides sp. zg-ZUI104]|uniref:sigma-70 family RNA polymerase sigma factor n=1 Tax=Nocardioides faecalis TaxID=2803858 RepID=UPI001BCCB5BB|nr:sigma-70 family RNA polymerase sigma factor [Nocardioides faecalis]MBS4752507.1 sigma-70 family RNA polymerase sigma factor [Nocardioides faecalis]